MNQPKELAIQPGIYEMPNDGPGGYREVDAVSCSYLTRMYESGPAAARVKFPGTAAMNIGKALHMLALEGEKMFVDNVVEADCKTTNAKAFNECEAFHPDKIILLKGEIDECYRIVDSMFRHPLVNEWLSNGLAEQSAFAIEKKTGLLCKCRPDYVNKAQKRILDLKFVREGDADPRKFAYSLRDRYMIQCGWYPAIYAAAAGWEVEEMSTGYITVEKSERSGYRTECHDIADEYVVYGWRKAMAMLELEVECRRNDLWPNYTFGGAFPQNLPQYLVDEP